MIDGTLIAYAFTVGLTGLINPCGLPLLPAYLALFLDDVDRPWPVRLVVALRAGACLTLGFVAVFGVTGVVTASLATAVTAFAPWFMLLVGAAVIVFGVLSVLGRAPTLHLPGFSFRPGRSAVAMVGFGAAYAIGSISCSLPIFVAAVGSALTVVNPVQSAAVFVAYALGMGLFATAASAVAGFTGPAVLRVLGPLARVLPRVAGAVCILVGLYLIGYWAHVLGAPDLVAPAVALDDRVQSMLTSWLDRWWIAAAGVSSFAVVGALLAVAFTAERRRTVHHAGTGDGPR